MDLFDKMQAEIRIDQKKKSNLVFSQRQKDRCGEFWTSKEFRRMEHISYYQEIYNEILFDKFMKIGFEGSEEEKKENLEYEKMYKGDGLFREREIAVLEQKKSKMPEEVRKDFEMAAAIFGKEYSKLASDKDARYYCECLFNDPVFRKEEVEKYKKFQNENIAYQEILFDRLRKYAGEFPDSVKKKQQEYEERFFNNTEFREKEVAVWEHKKSKMSDKEREEAEILPRLDTSECYKLRRAIIGNGMALAYRINLCIDDDFRNKEMEAYEKNSIYYIPKRKEKSSTNEEEKSKSGFLKREKADSFLEKEMKEEADSLEEIIEVPEELFEFHKKIESIAKMSEQLYEDSIEDMIDSEIEMNNLAPLSDMERKAKRFAIEDELRMREDLAFIAKEMKKESNNGTIVDLESKDKTNNAINSDNSELQDMLGDSNKNSLDKDNSSKSL